MNIPFVDLKIQYDNIKPEIDEAVSNILEKASFVGGVFVESFELAFAKYLEVNHCVACANGTDAIEIVLEALGIGKGDEVIVPAYTWVSTASAVNRVGATPVLVDIDPIYYTIDPARIEEAITKNTRAILPVHFYGYPADMPSICEIAKRHSLFVIEDASQAHGAEINGKKVGGFGDVATFSFYPGKNLGAYGDGGCIVTNSSSLADKSRVLARLGQNGKHNHLQVGRNSRLDTLQAAVLNVKLKYLDKWTLQRIENAISYSQALSNAPLTLPQCESNYQHCYHVYVIQSESRDSLQMHLKDNGISTQIHYPRPLNQLPFYKQFGYNCPVSDDIAPRLLSLPMYPEMTKEQIMFVGKCIKDFFYKQQ